MEGNEVAGEEVKETRWRGKSGKKRAGETKGKTKRGCETKSRRKCHEEGKVGGKKAMGEEWK